MNTFSLLLNAGFSSSEDTAVVFEDTRLSYESLKNRVYYISEALVKLGAGKGTHVGFADHNCCELAEVFFAVSKFGGTMVPLNFRENSETLLSLIDLSGIEILITSSAFADVLRRSKARLPLLKTVIARESPSGLDYRRLLAKRERSDFIADMNGDEANVLVFQRDEMGYLSAYAISYERILRTTEYLVFRRDASPDMRASLFCEPLYQIQSMPAIASAVYSGRKLVIMREFEPRRWSELVHRERITNTVLLPASLSTLLDNMPAEKDKLKSLEYIKLGVAAMPAELVRRACELLPDHIKFVNEYRPKKTAGIVACFISDAHMLEGTDEEVASKLRHLNSIGKTGSQTSEISIVDSAMNKVPAGAVGRIMVKETDGADWIDTGDLGWLDDEGYIYLAGNKTSVNVENPQHTRMDVAVIPAYYDGGSAVARNGIPGDTTPVPDMNDVFDFLRRVYESMEPDCIIRNYLDAAERIVSADAYGISFGTEKQLLTDYLDAQVSILSPFIGEPTEESVWMREPGAGWSMIPLRAYLRGEQAQIARIPMLSYSGSILGTLTYVRMGEREFTSGELARMRWMGSHMCVVVDNACKYRTALQSYEVAMSALNVIKSAVVISDGGRITFINKCAKEILDSAAGLYENGAELWDRLRQDVSSFGSSCENNLETSFRLHGGAEGDALVQLHTCRSGSGDSLITLLYSNIHSRPRAHSFDQVLSTREQEVLELITRGLKNQDIARELMISGNTVKFHIKQIYSKLSVGDRVELFNKMNIS